MNYKYQLDPSSKKFKCPRCGQKRFVRLIDADGNYLDSNYGRCDRQIKCQYDLRPSKTKDMKIIQSPLKPSNPSIFPIKVQISSMKFYDRNSLFLFLSNFYNKSSLTNTFKEYLIGTSKKWNGSPIFWQKDLVGEIRTGKIIAYDVSSGKRIKKPNSKISWSHKEIKLENFNVSQVLFGCHLISKNPNDIHCLVESEKTALICALEFPEFIWLATGGSQNFKREILMPLKGKNVMVFPDHDQHEKWLTKGYKLAKELEINMKFNGLVENLGKINQKNDISDIADLILSEKD